MQIRDIIKSRFHTQKAAESALHSIIYKTVIDTIKKEKNIDISEYLESVNLIKTTLIIKTNKPLIGEEIQHVSGILENNLKEKLEKIGKKYTNLHIITK